MNWTCAVCLGRARWIVERATSSRLGACDHHLVNICRHSTQDSSAVVVTPLAHDVSEIGSVGEFNAVVRETLAGRRAAS